MSFIIKFYSLYNNDYTTLSNRQNIIIRFVTVQVTLSAKPSSTYPPCSCTGTVKSSALLDSTISYTNAYCVMASGYLQTANAYNFAVASTEGFPYDGQSLIISANYAGTYRCRFLVFYIL